MLFEFDRYAAKGNEFLNRLGENLQSTDRAHTARVLRSTFRVLRNHLTFEESLHLLSQLPMVIKAVYVDGWRKGDHKKIKTIDDLLIEIVREDGENAWKDFGNKDDILDAVRAVIETMRLYVSAEEMDQALGTLPHKVQVMLEESDI